MTEYINNHKDFIYSVNLENNKDYYVEYTDSWCMIEQEENIFLYEFHDGVNWNHEYAIVINKTVKTVLGNIEYSEAIKIFESIVSVLKPEKIN